MPSGPRDVRDAFREETAQARAGTRPRSDETAFHDPGTDDEVGVDGLTAEEEWVRQAAEDVPTGAPLAGPIEDVPVFDRASLPPKV